MRTSHISLEKVVSSFYNMVNGLIVIPVYGLHNSQCSTRRSEDPNCHFTVLHSKSDTFNQTIRDWNDLPDNIIKANYRWFKKLLDATSSV